MSFRPSTCRHPSSPLSKRRGGDPRTYTTRSMGRAARSLVRLVVVTSSLAQLPVDARRVSSGARHQIQMRGGAFLDRQDRAEGDPMSILMYGGGGNSAVSHPYGRLTRYLKEQSKGGNDDIADGILSSALNQAGIRAREKTSMKLGEKAAQQLAKAAERRGLQRVAERGWDVAGRMGGGLTGRAGQRTAECSGGRGFGRILRRAGGGARNASAGQRLAERTLGRKAAQTGYSRTAKGSVRHVAEMGGRMGTASASSAALRISERMVRSIARVFLIMLPALGGFFALWLLKTDLKRIREVREERDEWEWRRYGTVSRSPDLSSIFFGSAAAADLVDAVSHFTIAYLVLVELGHNHIPKFEEMTIVCAVISTICAVAGEIINYRKQWLNQVLSH